MSLLFQTCQLVRAALLSVIAVKNIRIPINLHFTNSKLGTANKA